MVEKIDILFGISIDIYNVRLFENSTVYDVRTRPRRTCHGDIRIVNWQCNFDRAYLRGNFLSAGRSHVKAEVEGGVPFPSTQLNAT